MDEEKDRGGYISSSDESIDLTADQVEQTHFSVSFNKDKPVDSQTIALKAEKLNLLPELNVHSRSGNNLQPTVPNEAVQPHSSLSILPSNSLAHGPPTWCRIGIRLISGDNAMVGTLANGKL